MVFKVTEVKQPSVEHRWSRERVKRLSVEHLKDEGLENRVGNKSLGKGLHLRGAERVLGPGS